MADKKECKKYVKMGIIGNPDKPKITLAKDIDKLLKLKDMPTAWDIMSEIEMDRLNKSIINCSDDEPQGPQMG